MKQHRMRIKSTGLFFLLCFWLLFVFPSYAMDAPGSGGKNWSYGKDHHWTYRDQDGQLHTSWLYYEGEWYWFDEHGWMQTGGTRTIDGIRYFFFSNGHMAHNQYVDLKFLGEDGQEDKKGEIRVIGTRKPDSEDKDLITDYLYEVPRGWIRQFVKDGWQFLFYTKKTYFEAPSTSSGIYYVRYSTDRRYKKVKFCDADSILQAFGEYVAYKAGCYRGDSTVMQEYWKVSPVLERILEIPDYYAEDAGFCFGTLFSAYVSGEKTEELRRKFPELCEKLEMILHQKEEPADHSASSSHVS